MELVNGKTRLQGREAGSSSLSYLPKFPLILPGSDESEGYEKRK